MHQPSQPSRQPYPVGGAYGPAHHDGAGPDAARYAASYGPPPMPPPAPSNGMGTAALVLGILAMLLAFVPILGFVAYPLAVLGVVFGLVGLRKVGRAAATNRGVTVAGLVTSVLGLVLVVVSTVVYVSAINAGVRSVHDSLNAVHNITYQASSSTGGKVIVTYAQGRNGSGSAIQAKSPWSVDTTVTGPVAVLSVSSSVDLLDPDKQEGVSCAIVDKDTGATLVTNSVPASESATVTCTAGNLGS